MRFPTALAAFSTAILCACHESGTLYSSNESRAHLSIIASSSAAGERVLVQLQYQRTQAANIVISDQTFFIANVGEQQLSVPIDLTTCLDDAQRVVPRDGACSIVAVLKLSNAVGMIVDSSTVGPLSVSVGGQMQAQSQTLRSVGSVTVTPTKTTLAVGDTASAVAVARDRDNTILTGRGGSWLVGNGTVLSISQDGKFTALATGTSIVSSSIQNIVGTTTITVTPVQVASVTVSLAPAAMIVGGNSQATATAKSATGVTITGRAVIYASSNPTVATISASGAITAHSLGNTTILATVDGIQGSLQATVLTPPLAFAVADQPAATTYTATGFVSSGGTITINRQSVGTYFVIFNTFSVTGGGTTDNIGVHVAAGSGTANAGLTALASTCYVVAVSASLPLTFHVQCDAYAGGGAIDSPFRLTVMGAPDSRLPMPVGSGFSFSSDTTSLTQLTSVSPFTWSQTPGPVFVQRSLLFATLKGVTHTYPPSSPILPMGRYVTPIMSVHGRAPVCTFIAVENTVFAPVASCYAGAQAGVSERRLHWLIQMSGVYPGHEGASIAVNAATGQVLASSSWTTGTGTTIAHPAPGKYFITFEGINAGSNAFTVMLTATGATGMTGCSYFVRGSNPIALDIACANQTNVPTDPPSAFNVFVMR